MSVENNNYTINSVQYTISENSVIVDEIGQNYIELTIIPNSNYTVTASDFSLATPANPTYVTSVVFTQSGLNVLVTINLVTTALMPSENLDLGICISGSAQPEELTINGIYNTSVGVETTPANETGVAYSGTGDQGDLITLFTKTFTANSGFYITTTNVEVTQGNAGNYSFEEVPVYNAEGYMTSTTYTVKYLFPSASVSGDVINFTLRDKALPVVQPSVISSYSEIPPIIPATGFFIGFTVFGEPGAQYSANADDGSTVVPIANNQVIPASGQHFEIIEFPAYTGTGINTWTITLSGDLASPFIQPNPFFVKQYADITLTITAESSDNNVSFSPNTSFTVPALQTLGPVISEDILGTITITGNDTIEINNEGIGIYKEDIDVNGVITAPLNNASTINFTTFAENTGTLQVGDRFNINFNDPDNSNINQAPFAYEVTSVSGTAPNYTVGISPPLTLTTTASVAFFRLNGNISNQINPITLTQVTPKTINIEYDFTLLQSGDQDTTFTLDLDGLINVIASGGPQQQLSLCYATTENDLCCGLSTPVTVFVQNGETYNNAVMFYSDAALTTIAPDGFYSENATCAVP